MFVRRFSRLLPCILFPLLLNPALLSGQIFPQDIRLSDNRIQPFLSNDAKIQSAARIDSLTLVVWGSSREAEGTSTANVLYRQMLRDAVKLGKPEPLTDDRFDPIGFVQVTALEDRFFVVWNNT